MNEDLKIGPVTVVNIFFTYGPKYSAPSKTNTKTLVISC